LDMMSLALLGPLLERLLGTRRFVVAYGVSGLVGGVASACLTRVPGAAAASGATWGLIVVAAALVGRPRGRLPAVSRSRARRGVRHRGALSGQRRGASCLRCARSQR